MKSPKCLRMVEKKQHLLNAAESDTKTSHTSLSLFFFFKQSRDCEQVEIVVLFKAMRVVEITNYCRWRPLSSQGMKFLEVGLWRTHNYWQQQPSGYDSEEERQNRGQEDKWSKRTGQCDGRKTKSTGVLEAK